MSTEEATIDTTSGEAGWQALFWEAFRRSKNAMVLLDGERRHVNVNGAYGEVNSPAPPNSSARTAAA